MRLTKEEKKAREIAIRLVKVLAEIQLFFGNADLIFEDAKALTPTKNEVSEKQLKEIREQIDMLSGENTLTL